MTRQDFDRHMRRMLSLRFPPADLGEHYEQLGSTTEDIMAEAVTIALNTRRDFPTIAELRADISQAITTLPVVQRGHEGEAHEPYEFRVPNVDHVFRATKEWYHDCNACEDSGWQEFYCGLEGEDSDYKPWVVRRRCGRTREHAGHLWAQRCPCRETNPTIQRHIAQQQARIAAKAEP